MVSQEDADRIKQAVADELHRDPNVDTTDIRVQVSEETVSLQGTVPSEFARRAALAHIEAFCPDRRVDDQLVVRFTATSTTPSGEELRSAIESLLGWVPELEIEDPVVRMEEGTIVIEGRVDTESGKERIAEAIREHLGVVQLENRLAVAPGEGSKE